MSPDHPLRTALLDALGDPHQSFASLHIAGTNGKGSVTAMAETALRRAGYRTARYTSPHLERLEERFVIDGAEVSTADLRLALSRVRSAVEDLVDRGVLTAPPTFFECTTAAAFELFRGAGVEIAVLEVGLGGRLDATNVVRPIATAITTIDFDHQAQLGSTILVEAALSFLGLGVPEPHPSWGRMLSESAAEYVRVAPWLVIFPGAAISLAVFGTNLLGDALRDILDPRQRD
jgi:folylpolyglutamate synthase/dihydropteroate synthase